MLPCCVFGALFMIQLMAFSRWVKRAILKQPQLVEETEYWVPERVTYKEKFKLLISNKRSTTLLLSGLAIQLTIFSAVYLLGGFDVITRGYQSFANDAPGTLAYLYQCCFG